jgi:salicylate hydroxylase
MGAGAHALTFPVKHGELLNLVAFAHSDEDWPDYKQLTLPARREDAYRDFKGFGPNIQALISLTKPDLDRWAIFDLGDHPLPTYHKGRVCLSGDSAHATSPHHGAGAGAAIEDSAVLSELLADERVTMPEDLEAVFATFDACRREVTQALVQSSRRCGDLYEWQATDVGKDVKKIESELRERDERIWDADIRKVCIGAKVDMAKRLQGMNQPLKY